MYIDELKPSTDVAISVQTDGGKTVRIVLLSEKQAENSWKFSTNGRDHLILTRAEVFVGAESIHLRSRDVSAFSFSIFPRTGEQLIPLCPCEEPAVTEPSRVTLLPLKQRESS